MVMSNDEKIKSLAKRGIPIALLGLSLTLVGRKLPLESIESGDRVLRQLIRRTKGEVWKMKREIGGAGMAGGFFF